MQKEGASALTNKEGSNTLFLRHQKAFVFAVLNHTNTITTNNNKTLLTFAQISRPPPARFDLVEFGCFNEQLNDGINDSENEY